MKLPKILVVSLILTGAPQAFASRVSFDKDSESKEITKVALFPSESGYRLQVIYESGVFKESTFELEMKSYGDASQLAHDLMEKRSNAIIALQEGLYGTKTGTFERIYLRKEI